MEPKRYYIDKAAEKAEWREVQSIAQNRVPYAF